MMLPELKPIPKSEYEQSKNRKQTEAIMRDIKKIDDALIKDDEAELRSTHQYIDGKYYAFVSNWGHSMYSYTIDFGFDYNYIDKSSLIHNLTHMKAVLEGLSLGFNVPKSHIASNNNNVNISVSNNNEISISASFEQAKEQVESMNSLTIEQTKEILDKITEIENVFNSIGSKKTKWEKIKPILIWLADKSFDVGMILLPLLLKLEG